MLAANLVTNANMLEAMHRLGGMSRLEEVAARYLDDPRLQSVNAASGAMEGGVPGGSPNPNLSPNPNFNPNPNLNPNPSPNSSPIQVAAHRCR